MLVLVLLICFGPAVLQREFWANSFQDIPRWLKGEDSISVMYCLRDRNFYAFFASFAPPLIYALGAAGAVGMVFRRRWSSDKLFLIPLSVYGLGVYAHFLWHATINYYYMAPLPLVGCVCFWSTEYLNKFKILRQRVIKLIFVVIAGIGLFTNFLFTYYPNVFNIAGEDWGQEKAVYRANFNFDSDADLVRQAAVATKSAAIISGFATEILIRADKAPYFYSINTVMGQLDQGKPQQVFVDKRILSITGSPTIDALMGYLRAHYQYNGRQSNSLILLERGHE
jgi:hypothetical protein